MEIELHYSTLTPSESQCIRIKPIEIVVVLAIIGGLFALFYPMIQSARNPKEPNGQIIPSDPPKESNRITHASGLSIVAPVNWDQVRENGSNVPFLCIAARGRPGTRLNSIITISIANPSPDESKLKTFNKVEFQQRPAHEKIQVLREWTFDDPAQSSYDLYLNRDGKWWHINFFVAQKLTELPPDIRRYINTVAFP